MVGHAVVGPRRVLKVSYLASRLVGRIGRVGRQLQLRVHVDGRDHERAHRVGGELDVLDERHLHHVVVALDALVRPVHVALETHALLELGHHDDGVCLLLPHHAPEVADGRGQRALGGDVARARPVAVHVVGVYVVAVVGEGARRRRQCRHLLLLLLLLLLLAEWWRRRRRRQRQRRIVHVLMLAHARVAATERRAVELVRPETAAHCRVVVVAVAVVVG